MIGRFRSLVKNNSNRIKQKIHILIYLLNELPFPPMQVIFSAFGGFEFHKLKIFYNPK